MDEFEETMLSLMKETKKDADELFLLSLAPQMKRLTPETKSMARMRIQMLMHELEFGKCQPVYFNVPQNTFDFFNYQS